MCAVWVSSKKGGCSEAPVCRVCVCGGAGCCSLHSSVLFQPLPASWGWGSSARLRQGHCPECPLCLASAESDPLQAWIPH